MMSSRTLQNARPFIGFLTFFIAGCSSLPPAGTLEGNAASTEVAALFWGRHVIVPTYVTESASAFLVLDSGANMTVLDQTTARALGLTVSGSTQVEGYGEDVLEGGVAELAIGLAGSVHYRLYRPGADLSRVDAPFGRRFEGVLGADFFGRFVVEIDHRNGVLYLRPNARFDEPFEVDMAGFGIVAEGVDLRQYRVSWIDQDSPAERAGLRSGDLLVEVDDRRTDTLIMPDWNQLRRGPPGQLLRLVVERGDQTLAISISLESRL